MMQALIDLQRTIHEAVNGLFGRFAETGDWRSLFVILALGIGFGAVHALTPHVAGEGVFVGFAAGLIPCPPTLFAMVLALANSIALAGLTFALAMLFGVGFTLMAVAVGTVVARERSLTLLSRHGASIERISRSLDFVSGYLLLTIGALAVVAGL